MSSESSFPSLAMRSAVLARLRVFGVQDSMSMDFA
jgi:hypothetical protein